MIEEIDTRVEKFQGALSRVRCFAHVVQLVGKGMLQQFEPPKKKKKKDDEPEETPVDGDDTELLALLDDDEDVLEGEVTEGDCEDVDRDSEDRDLEGVDDEYEGSNEEEEDARKTVGMTDEERAELRAKCQPVRLALTKVGGNRALVLKLYLLIYLP